MSIAPKQNVKSLGTPLCTGMGADWHSEEDVEERLTAIAIAIRQGADPEEYQAEIDKLLGTEMEERDEHVEAAWEQSYRNKGPLE